MSRTHISIVLHSHLPFVRHPENPFHLEEMWFFEAMHETYLPLLQALRRLDAQGVPGKLTVSLSAPLLSMMKDPLLLERFEKHLHKLIELSESELQRTMDQGPEFAKLAAFYNNLFKQLRDFYVDDLKRDTVGAFKQLHESGRIELITCVGTHPIMPFLKCEGSRRAHVKAACDLFATQVGWQPRGIWLAECAFAKGCDKYLAEQGIMFTFVEGLAIENADAAPVYGNYAPLISDYDVAFFGRDHAASAQVWSASEGYPGDFVYREFYRDLGFDLEMDYIQPYIHPDGIRLHTGLKYHRITGDVALGDKQPYDPDVARERANQHAEHFVHERLAQSKMLNENMGDRSAHICCPYDAELFGHWWFEGPLFLEALFHHASKHENIVLSTPLDYLNETPVQQQTTPATSTWGEDSDFSVWLDESNAWIYRHLRNAEEIMEELASTHHQAHGVLERALAQTARELLLAQSSDWPFIMKTATAVEYATTRLSDHLQNFDALVSQIQGQAIDEQFLASLEQKNNIFPALDWRIWGQ